MEPRAFQGRQLVIGVIAACLFISIVTIGFSNFAAGPQQLPQQAIRLLLTILLCALLYQGRNWVRWVLGILFLLGGLGSLVGGLALLPIPWVAATLFVMAIVYLICGSILLFSSNVRVFLAHQRTHRHLSRSA